MKTSTAALAVLTALALAAPAWAAAAPVKKPALAAAAKKPSATATAPNKAPPPKPASRKPGAKPAAPARKPARPQTGASDRTEAIFVTPPEGWTVGAWSGGTVELGAFTPAGQTRDAYVDLLAYSVVPRIAGTNDSEEEMRAFERKREGCRTIMVRDHEGAAGWYDSEYLCIGREGAKPDAVEIEVSSVRLGKQGVFRIWRSWRGSPAELSGMLKDRFGVDLQPVRGVGAEATTDDKDLGAAFTALADAFYADVARNEICDLAAAAGCASLHATAPESVADTRPKEPFVAGFLAPAHHRVSREDFRAAFKVSAPDDGTPNRVIIRLQPTDAGWLDPTIFSKAVLAVGMGQAADGGAMYLIDRENKLDAARRTRALARLLSASRQLWQIGHAPDTVVVLGGDQAAPPPPDNQAHSLPG
jgi:hypothetical protein